MPETIGTAVDLTAAIEMAIQDPVTQTGGKPVAIIAEYPAHLPAVRGERASVVQAITGLMAAAVEATEAGEIRVRGELLAVGDTPKALAGTVGEPQALARGGPWAVVSVLAPQARISFERLQAMYAGAPEAAVSETAPLSLAACRAAMERFGGRVWLEGQEEGGARFALALPLMAAPISGADVSSLRRVVETRLPEGGGPIKTLLVMVDDPDLRNLLSVDLAAAGYRLVVATSGSEVHQLAREEFPDLILLDLLVRDPSSFDIAMVLKQDRRTRNVPVLFLTSIADPQVGVRMGAVNFVVRPAGTGALVSTIRSVLEAGLSPSARVLIVEPDQMTREMMIMTIQAHGYRVTEATRPEEALVLAERVPPAMALVNAKLAQERDYWLLRGLRQLSEAIEIFVMADAMSEAEGQAAIRRGASGFSETGKLPDLLDRVRSRRTGV